MKNAYMIRNDGKAIPVVQHLYGNRDEVTETLFAGEWLYDNTLHESTREIFICLIAAYARFYEKLENVDTLIEDLKKTILGYPYKFLSIDFVDDHKDDILKAYTTVEMSGGWSEMEKLSRKIVSELNQEFLRARYGGMYNTSSSSKEMVFRISSTGFNWYNIIWQFVYDNTSYIKSVTIVRDEESTGVQNAFYRSNSGALYNQMPVEEFLMESGNPVVESEDPVRKHLMEGKSLEALKDLSMNKDRIEYRYKCLVQQENTRRMFWLEFGVE